MSLEIETQADTVLLSGSLNECCNLEHFDGLVFNVHQQTKCHRVNLDFSNVKHANSCGLARWVAVAYNFSVPVAYVNAPIWLVEQFNILNELFKTDVIVRSFFANFYCPELDHNKTILLTVGKEIPLLPDYEKFEITLSIDGEDFEPDFEAESLLFFLAMFLYPARERYGPV